MTLLLATLREKFGLISQDTFVAPPLTATPTPSISIGNTGHHERISFTDNGAPIDPIGHVLKISIWPHLRTIGGFSGTLDTMVAWDAHMRRNVPAGSNIAEVHAAFDPVGSLKALGGATGGQGCYCVLIGLGFKGRLRGYVYAVPRNEDGRAEELECGVGHSMSHPLDDRANDYPQLHAASEAARSAEDFVKLHQLMARNIYRSYLRGRFYPGSGIGGELHTAIVDESGIRVCATDCFN